MCIKCKEALDKHFPNLSWEEKYAILMELTAYPFADGDYTANQIAEVARIGLSAAYKLVDEEMTTALAEMHLRETKKVAYSLWEEAGRPESDGVEFWLEAERLRRMGLKDT